MQNEANDNKVETPPNSIRIKINGFENIRPVYCVAEITMKAEFLDQVLGESEKFHVAKKDFIATDFEVVIPCDLSSPKDLDTYISNPIIITVTETQMAVDMSTVEVVGGVEKPTIPESTSKTLMCDAKSSAKKGKRPSKSKGKEKSSKGSKGSKDSKTKSKVKKNASGSSVKQAKPEPTGPRVLGVTVLDLLPIFLGPAEFTETLPIQQISTCLDDKAVPIKCLPRIEVTVQAEGALFTERDTSVLSISLESIYNLPGLMGPDCRYQICVMMPNSTSTLEPVLFKDGKYKQERNLDNFMCWPTESVSGAIGTRTKYMIDEELSNIRNKIDVNLGQAMITENPRIEWNVLKRNFLVPERLEYLYKQIKKFRKIPIEIYVTPAKELDEPGKDVTAKSKSSSKTGKKKEKGSKGKGSSNTTKSKIAESTKADGNDLPPEYLHLMGFVDVGSLLYPGATTCRVMCRLNTYHEYEIMELAGQNDSYYRPRPPPEVVTSRPTTSKKSKGKGKGGKKEKKGSKSTKSSKSKSKSSKSSGKGKKGKKQPEAKPAIDLAQYLPPPPPPRPEPSKPVYADNGTVTFILVEFELIKPLHRQRQLEDLSKSLDCILPKKPQIPKRLISTKVALEIFNETVRSIANDMNVQFQNWTPTCECENVQTFLTCLEQSGVYRVYLTSMMRAITALVREKYPYEAEIGKTIEKYQVFMSEIYTDLVQQMNSVINESMLFNVEKTPGNIKTCSDDLLFYAKEVMELGAPKTADRYYLQRICYDEQNANYWFDYAVFQMELANVEKAVECVKEALHVDPIHRYSLLMYGILLAGDGLMAEAETCLLTMSVLYPRWVEGWGALHIFYQETKNEEGVDVTMEMAIKFRDDPGAVRDYFMETNDLAWSSTCYENIYLRTAILLIKMRLLNFAERTVVGAMLNHRGHCEYLLGVIIYYRQDYSHALEHLVQAKELIGADFSMCGLIGHCLTKLKNFKDGLTYYTRVLEMYDRPEDVHMVFLYAAICLDEDQDSQSARQLALLACKLSPSPQTWLHAGGYYFKQNDLISSEDCLTQANLCDNRLPDVWGLLALVNACLGREHESDMCFMRAKKFNLKDEQLMAKIVQARNDMYDNLRKDNDMS